MLIGHQYFQTARECHTARKFDFTDWGWFSELSYNRSQQQTTIRVLIRTFCIFVVFCFTMHVVHKRPFVAGASDTFLSRHLQPVTVANLLACLNACKMQKQCVYLKGQLSTFWLLTAKPPLNRQVFDEKPHSDGVWLTMEPTEKPHDSHLKVLCLSHVFKALIYCIISVFLRNNKWSFCVSASSWVPSTPS